MKIIVDKNISKFEELVSLLDDLKDIDFRHLKTEQITNSSIRNAEILFVRSTLKITSNLLDKTNIKFVGSATSGFDHINTSYLENNSIDWCYSPGCNSSSVVHYVMSSIDYVINNNLFDKDDVVGIVGYGNIGSKLSKALNAIGIRNISYDPLLDLKSLKTFDQVKKCKLISFHIPLTVVSKFPTRNIINTNLLNNFENKIIINTSRGEIADETAILNNKNITYISDVWCNEPLPKTEIINHSLISTPHIAGYSYDGRINGTINLFKELFIFLGFDENKQNKNNKFIKDFLGVKEINYYPTNISDYSKSFDILKESMDFKILTKGFKKKLPAEIFLKKRSKHISRRDILPH